MSVSPTVLVACDDLILLDEVIRHLEEIPHWRLVMSARSADELLNSVHRPDCALVSDSLAVQLAGHPRSARLTADVVVFGRQETAPALRAALALGARGFVHWPEQQDQLQALVERGRATPAKVPPPSGALHAVWAPKGGAGASVIAAHLAGSLGRLGKGTILVDLDLDHADQTCLLGAEPDVKTVGDLLRVADELSEPTVRSVVWSHPLGFEAIFAPGRPAAAPAPEAVGAVLQAIRGMAEHVVADLPSGDGLVTRAAMEAASSLYIVLTPDLLALRRARDLLKRLRTSGVRLPKLNVVLNQAGGADVTSKEVEAVLGVRQVTRVRADIQIYRVANRGELSPVACKLLTPLAKRLTGESGDAPVRSGEVASLVLQPSVTPEEEPEAVLPAPGSYLHGQPAPRPTFSAGFRRQRPVVKIRP